MPTRILVANGEVLVRQAITALLERHALQVVAEASNGLQAVELALEHRPDVAVLDRLLPRLNGLSAARQIGRVSARTAVILLASFGDDDFVLDGFQDGVRGFVLKTQPSEDLVQAIREVSHGERERQVLQLVAEGKTTKEVAALLQISVRTADYHRTRVMKRLNIHDTAGLVRYAIRQGFMAP